MSKVFAVFSREDVDRAIDLLSERGYADDYKIIDRHNLRDERLLGLPGQGTTEGSSTAIGGMRVIGTRNDQLPSDVGADAPMGAPVTEGQTEHAVQELTGMDGISEEEAEYFARNIFDGASVVVVEVDSNEQAQEVEDLLQQAGAQSANA